jgi:two-component system, response regulator
MITRTKEKYILLVEDNSDDVMLTEIAMRKSQTPNKMMVVWDGEEALDFLFHRGRYAAREGDDDPAVIILDLKLPRVDGLEVLEQIKADKRTSSIPVVILTSSTEDKDQSESRRLGADEYICKPTGLTQLIEIIQRVRSTWLK